MTKVPAATSGDVNRLRRIPSLPLAAGPGVGPPVGFPIDDSERQGLGSQLQAIADARSAATSSLLETLDRAARSADLRDPCFVACSDGSTPSWAVAAMVGTSAEGDQRAVPYDVGVEGAAHWYIQSLGELLPSPLRWAAGVLVVEVGSKTVVFSHDGADFWRGHQWVDRWVPLRRNDAGSIGLDALALLRLCDYADDPSRRLSRTGDNAREFSPGIVGDHAWSEWQETCRASPLHRVVVAELSREGWTPAEARLWMDTTGAPLKDLKGWRDLGLSPEEVKRWVLGGFHGPDDVRPWLRVGATTLKAIAWMDRHPPLDPERFDHADWKSRGIRPGRAAAAWAALGLSPEEAHAWQEMGCRAPEDVRRAAARGLTHPRDLAVD